MLKGSELEKVYPCGTKALRGVSLELKKGAALGLVGESGCGKSTLARAICKMGSVDRGTLSLDGVDCILLRNGQRKKFHKRVQLVFQENSACLDPRATVTNLLGEPLDNYYKLKRKQKQERIESLLEDTGIDANKLTAYPHQLSGGQRQRVVIARALASAPDYLICDEPVSSLDGRTQGQILDLLCRLRARMNMGILLISHDLSVVTRVCENIAVMFDGRIVEELPAESVRNAEHPYTRSLFSYVFDLEECCCTEKPPVLRSYMGGGCSYHSQCPHSSKRCEDEEPELAGEYPHRVACHKAVQG